jgi:NAD-dependent DNA ligase
MKTSELKESTLPQEFLDLLPEFCESIDDTDETLHCGGELEITETLTKLYCPNPFCPEKGVQRAQAMLKDLGVLNLGVAKIRRIMENFDIYNPYFLFAYEPEEDGTLFDGCSMEFSYKIFEQLERVRTMHLWEYVKYGNFPGIRDGARKMLEGYSSLEEFYDDLEDGGIAFVQDKLGIKKGSKVSDTLFGSAYEDLELDLLDGSAITISDVDNTVSILCIQVYQTLMVFKEQLFEFIESVDIRSASMRSMNICISTSVGAPYKSKKEFVDTMNEKYGSQIYINKLDSLTKDCECLVCSTPNATTNKVRKAKDWGIPILTGVEFEEMIQQYL